MPFQETADCLTASYGTKWNGNASATNGSLFATQSVAFDTRNGMAPHGSMLGDVISPTLRAKEAEPPMVMQPTDVPEVMSTLLSSTAGVSRPGNAATEHETYIPMCFQQNTRDEVRYINGDGQIAGALAAESGMKQQNYLVQPIPFGVSEQQEVGHCLRANASKADKHESTTYVAQPIPLDSMNIFRSPEADASTGCGLGEEGEAMFTITKTNHHAVAQPLNIYGGNKRSDRPEGGFYVRMDEDTSKTLDAASGLNPTANQGGTAVIQPIAFSSNMSVPDCQVDVSPTLKLGGHGGGNPPAIAVDLYNQTVDGDTAATLTEACGGTNTSGPKVMQTIAPALTTNDPSRSPQASEVTQQIAAVHAASMAVRRLTPRECERLQGFPDDYTNIKENCPDGPRYKALGNSMAVPVMRWIGDRIRMVNELPK